MSAQFVIRDSLAKTDWKSTRASTQVRLSGNANIIQNQHSKLENFTQFKTGERPFACDLCNQTFTYKYLVKRHYQRTLNAHIKMHQLSQPTSSQQDSFAAVVSSSTSNSPITSNPCDIGDGISVELLNSSTPQPSQEIGQLSLISDLLLPHDNLQKSQRYTTEKTDRQQLLSSMLFGCAAAVNSNRAKELLSNDSFQESQEQKQQKTSFITYTNYSKAHHHDFDDSMDFPHIPPLIPIDSNSHLLESYEK